jgi:hypothetical protein
MGFQLKSMRTSVTDDDVAALLGDWDRRGVICGVVTDGPNPGGKRGTYGKKGSSAFTCR